jgi:hypothetical protein
MLTGMGDDDFARAAGRRYRIVVGLAFAAAAGTASYCSALAVFVGGYPVLRDAAAAANRPFELPPPPVRFVPDEVIVLVFLGGVIAVPAGAAGLCTRWWVGPAAGTAVGLLAAAASYFGRDGRPELPVLLPAACGAAGWIGGAAAAFRRRFGL